MLLTTFKLFTMQVRQPHKELHQLEELQDALRQQLRRPGVAQQNVEVALSKFSDVGAELLVRVSLNILWRCCLCCVYVASAPFSAALVVLVNTVNCEHAGAAVLFLQLLLLLAPCRAAAAWCLQFLLLVPPGSPEGQQLLLVNAWSTMSCINLLLPHCC